MANALQSLWNPARALSHEDRPIKEAYSICLKLCLLQVIAELVKRLVKLLPKETLSFALGIVTVHVLLKHLMALRGIGPVVERFRVLPILWIPTSTFPVDYRGAEEVPVRARPVRAPFWTTTCCRKASGHYCIKLLSVDVARKRSNS